MAQKKAIVGTLAFLLVALLMVGYFALASELGGKDDPIVTLGYLKTLEPELKDMLKELAEQEYKTQSAKLESDYNTAKKDLQDMISQLGGGENLADNEDFVSRVADSVIAKMGSSGTSTGAAPETMKKVEIPANKTVTIQMGSMFLLRLGSATCYATGSPGLIDLTSGAELANGGAIEKNHLYTVTVDSGRGIKTGSGTVTIFIIGSYTVS